MAEYILINLVKLLIISYVAVQLVGLYDKSEEYRKAKFTLYLPIFFLFLVAMQLCIALVVTNGFRYW